MAAGYKVLSAGIWWLSVSDGTAKPDYDGIRRDVNIFLFQVCLC
jgi:hypothetical protein